MNFYFGAPCFSLCSTGCRRHPCTHLSLAEDCSKTITTRSAKYEVPSTKRLRLSSGVATGWSRGADCHPWQRKICQKSGKRGKNQEKSGKKEEKSGRKGKNREGSFTLPLLTDRASYATAFIYPNLKTMVSPTWQNINPLHVDFKCPRQVKIFHFLKILSKFKFSFHISD